MTGKSEDITDPTASVEDQRADLAETVSALAAKADVPARVSNEAAHQTARASTAIQNNPTAVAGVVGTVVAALIVTIVLRRRRANRKFLR